MKSKMTIIAVLLMMLSSTALAVPDTNATTSTVNGIYRTWVRNGEHFAGARFYRYGGEKYPHEVWLESRSMGGGEPLRIRVPLDSLSDDDIDYLQKNHSKGFPADYKRKKSEQSLAPVSGTRGTPAAYAPGAPGIPER
jgi:hypothetical protein